jgi:HAD superfamily hydrolase (TIGR01549 family)
MIQAIIFDLDDTIWNYSEADTFACLCVFKKISIKTGNDISQITVLYKKIVGEIKSSTNISNRHNKIIYFKKMLEKLSVHIDGGMPSAFIGDLMDEYNKEFMSKLKLSSGIRELFELLKKNNVKIGVLSNNHFNEQYNRLKHFSLVSFIDVILTTDEIGEEKPSILPFLHILHQLGVSPEHTIMVGDNPEHDMKPAFDVNIGLCILYKPSSNHFIFGSDIKGGGNPSGRPSVHMAILPNFETLQNWLEEMFLAISTYKYLCGYFSQSFQNIQGSGGNISIKLPCKTILIKSSGSSLGDPDAFCIVNQETCQKIIGNGKPSMETGFHCEISSPIVVHLHFLPILRYLCCDYTRLDFSHFKHSHAILPYCHPGKDLGHQIKKLSIIGDTILFLCNHGIVLCGTSVTTIRKQYRYLFHFSGSHHKHHKMYEFYDAHEHKLDGRFVYPVEITTHDFEHIRHIKYCFPDMVVFLEHIDDEICMTKNTDIVLTKDKNIYIIASCLKESLQKREVLQSYLELCRYNYDHLVEIEDITTLRKMPNEIERKIKNRI